MATIRQIAQQAGVSPATVSRVLNYDQTLAINESTRRKVFAVAEKMHYQHSPRKHKRTSKLIALILWYSPEQEIKDTFYFSIRSGIKEEAQLLGYQVTTIYRGDALNELVRVEGVIVVGFNQYTKKRLQEIAAYHKPIVFVAGDALTKGYCSVIPDFHASIAQIVTHFRRHGQKTIGMLAGDLRKNFDPQQLIDFRFQDFKRNYAASGLYDPHFIYVGSFTPESGYQAIKQAIAKHQKLPQGLIVANDAMAIGALKALREASLRIPQDISIISFNDTSAAEFANPSLSSVHVDTHEMGQLGVKVLRDQINDDLKTPFRLMLKTKLILRESSIN